jgi:hypothetical protein
MILRYGAGGVLSGVAGLAQRCVLDGAEADARA